MNMPRIKYVVYLVTFPNGKIYVGKDIGGSGHALRYFGSWDCRLVEDDFSDQDLKDFTLRKQILFESADKSLVSKRETELIMAMQSYKPDIGYNRSHGQRISVKCEIRGRSDS